jgi:thymidylate synthase (FAD)
MNMRALLSPEQAQEIESQMNFSRQTWRPVATEMEAQLHYPHQVLDRGFVRIVDYMGNDEAIVQAARVSYGRGTKHGQSNEGLINYLMRHWHTTPFEMCEIKLHVKLPVFVARQWIRHRTANINEYSARYSILDREFYIPQLEDMAAQSTSNKQGRGEVLDPDQAAEVREILIADAMNAYGTYEQLLREPAEGGYGLARELARMNLPTNIYTQWYWKTDLHNLFHFLRLRADSHAQFEIRAYANVLCSLVSRWVPIAYKAFENYQLNAKSFSGAELATLRDLLNPEVGWDYSNMRAAAEEASARLTQRERDEFLAKLFP